MVHDFAVALFGGERGEVEVEEVTEDGGVLAEDLGALGLKLMPAGPGVTGGVGDVADEADPLEVGAGDIAFGVAALVVERAVALLVQEGGDDFGSTFPVVDG